MMKTFLELQKQQAELDKNNTEEVSKTDMAEVPATSTFGPKLPIEEPSALITRDIPWRHGNVSLNVPSIPMDTYQPMVKLDYASPWNPFKSESQELESQSTWESIFTTFIESGYFLDSKNIFRAELSLSELVSVLSHFHPNYLIIPLSFLRNDIENEKMKMKEAENNEGQKNLFFLFF